jgi:hypothetical protein
MKDNSRPPGGGSKTNCSLASATHPISLPVFTTAITSVNSLGHNQ